MKNKTKILITAFILLVGFKSVSQAQAVPILSLGSAEGTIGVGATITVPLIMSSNDSATGFNLDINYDSNALGNPIISASQSLVSAEKSISSSSPLNGVFRMIVIGLNQNIIPEGEIASLTFEINSDASDGSANLSISNLNATNANGESVLFESQNGSVKLQEKNIISSIVDSIIPPSVTQAVAQIVSNDKSSENHKKKKKKKKKKKTKTNAPTVKTSNSIVRPGQTIIQSGSGLSKNSWVRLYFPGGSIPVKTSSLGSFSVSYTLSANKPKGTYNWYVIDTAKKTKSKISSYTVR